MSASAKPPVSTTPLYTAQTPVEKLCEVGDPMMIEWKKMRHHTLFRGARAEFIASADEVGKSHLSHIPESSFIVVDSPAGQAAAGFEFNAPLVIRFLSGGTVFAFKSTLLRLHSHPPVMVLSYPDVVQRHNLRASERISTLFSARVSDTAGAVSRMGAVVDLSATGAGVALNTQSGIEVGGRLNLSCTLPNGAVISHLSSIVRNVRKEGVKYLLGLSFVSDDAVIKGFYRECAAALE